ncbi:MAG: hypothetical protein M0030_23805 [Actinomycetota bacterium]|nr:hypothetical protein [Actinomycetota bacterium]
MAELHGVPGHDRGTARAVPERDASRTVTGRVLVFCPACADRLPFRVRGPHPGWAEAIAALNEHVGAVSGQPPTSPGGPAVAQGLTTA